MAIFKKSEPPAQKPRERPMPLSRSQADAAISIIGTGMTVVGDISTEGIVRVEGSVRGTIRAGTAVVLGQGGTIEGNVLTQDAVIGGRVSGSVVASNRLELQSTCTVDGEISTRAEHLKLEEGARFAGQVQMIEDDAPAVQPAQPEPVTAREPVALVPANGSDNRPQPQPVTAKEPEAKAAEEESAEAAQEAEQQAAKERKKAEAR